YIRNSYKGSFKLTQGEDGTIGVIDIKYGQELTQEFLSEIIDSRPTRQGYEFLGWDCVYASMPAFEINIYAKWQAKDVTFKLSIYLESLSGNGEYDWDTVSTKTAKAGSSYTYEENCQSLQRDGFILLEFDTVIIDGDGSTEIEIYYKRNKYTVTYLVRNDAFYEQELFYEQEIKFDNVNTPNVPGYNFENWECKYENMPSKNIEALAILSLKEPVVENSQLNMEKVYDGIDLCICIEVSHDLENIEYKWYKGDEIICQDKELKLKDVCQSGTYYLVATIRDGENCCHKRSDDIVVEISKAQVDLSQVSFLNKEVTYDGNCHEIVIDGYLPNEVRVTYENNSGIEIGEYRAKAIFEVGDNYSPIAPMEAVLNIIAKPKGNPIDENDSKEDKELEQNCKNRITLTSDDLCKDSLSLEVADCTISMCKASLESLKNKALSSPIALAVDKVEKEDLHIPNFLQPEKSEIYNLALFVGDEQVEFLERVEISIPYTLDNNAKLQVWQWQNNEFKEISGVTYQDGYVNFVADGLSYIVIGVESQDQAPTIANDVLLMTGCLSIIGLIIISVIIIKSVKKKKTK
ncbi:MAG: hypothetical protein GX242_00045, partial [Clostridiales bacterium]|nr:hypothetical protein [Clostridiales bacterium]